MHDWLSVINKSENTAAPLGSVDMDAKIARLVVLGNTMYARCLGTTLTDPSDMPLSCLGCASTFDFYRDL